MPIALTASAKVVSELNRIFNASDVKDALTFGDRPNFLKTQQENYENSSSCWTKFKNFIGIKENQDNITEQWNQRAVYLEKINAIARQHQLSEQKRMIFQKTIVIIL